jgi:hypothetical protein
VVTAGRVGLRRGLLPRCASQGRGWLIRPATLALAVLMSMSGNAAAQPQPAALAPEQARSIIAAEAERVVQALKSRDMNALSKMVHPVQGVRFSPYAWLNRKVDVRFSAAMIRTALTDARVCRWGSYDGSARPIRLSFRYYFKRFVYDRDFVHAAEIRYNGGQDSGGNTHNNAQEVYPQAIIVAFDVPGPASHEDDFRILRLVFEAHHGTWYLVHIVHDEWTI